MIPLDGWFMFRLSRPSDPLPLCGHIGTILNELSIKMAAAAKSVAGQIPSGFRLQCLDPFAADAIAVQKGDRVFPIKAG